MAGLSPADRQNGQISLTLPVFVEGIEVGEASAGSYVLAINRCSHSHTNTHKRRYTLISEKNTSAQFASFTSVLSIQPGNSSVELQL